ncbi:phage tail sheath family protein [Microbacterium pumilum]|uniref:Phage tail sheath family protein n=1 Tax=Microbacterium pumilum TaxID=344165 RepID=A0ABN2T2X1_9MICO
MPEYLTPGVYVEETSFRSRSIEGVATSTFGMAGLTRYGPVPYIATLPGNRVLTMTPSATLVTSFAEFERAFGGLDPVGTLTDTTNYLAFAARAFFANGGRRLYVARVFPFTPDPNDATAIGLTENLAQLAVGTPVVGTFRARWPGVAAQGMSVSVRLKRSKNVFSGTLKGVRPGALIELFSDNTVPKDDDPPNTAALRIVDALNATTVGLRKADGTVEAVPPGTQSAFRLTVTVDVRWGGRFDSYPGLEVDPSGTNPRSIVNVLRSGEPADEMAVVWFDPGAAPASPADVLAGLLTLSSGIGGYLTLGGEGTGLTASVIKGRESDPDDPSRAAVGLGALAEVEDIAIVASPDAVRLAKAEQVTATNDLIEHCAPGAYRIGIVDPPKDSSISKVREFRAQFDTSYAALYYPWMDIVDPTARPDPGAPPPLIQLPPSGFTAGIYARSDIERGVHKAPANEVVRGIVGFKQNVTFDRQSVLNPEGINALRFFEGRANRVWGARTMSSDPEWKYVNVRRLFLFLEHSIERSTQWAVFEPNNHRLWASIRQSVEDFLVTVWRTGALMGTKPEEAFFVRCDRTTMTQNDLDNGRMICLIGVAPTYPAEFVIFRIGQWTADSQQS